MRRAFVFILLIVALLALLYSWQSSRRIQLLSKLQQSTMELEKIEEQNRLFKLEVARAFSLERIERLAKEMGMVKPPLKFLLLR
jgi:cell division protein FtsL